MRLSTNMIYQQQISGVLNAQGRWLAAGEQLATGKRVNKSSDDPVSAANAVLLQQAQAQGGQYAAARNFATQRISIEESTLQQVANLFPTIKGILVAANSGTLSDNDRASYAIQLKGIRDQLLNLANGTDGNGRYLFAGYKSDSLPFSIDAKGQVTYHGGSTEITQKVDANRTMTTSHTGEQVFMSLTGNARKEPDSSPGEANIFNTLQSAIAALDKPLSNDKAATEAFHATMDKAMRGLSNFQNNVLAVRSELGSSLSELENLDSQGEDNSVIMQTQLSNLVSVDYTSIISDYTRLQAELTASYTAFQQMAKLSLFQLHQ